MGRSVTKARRWEHAWYIRPRIRMIRAADYGRESQENRIREVMRNQLRQEIRDNGGPCQAGPVGNWLRAAMQGLQKRNTTTQATVLITEDGERH